jgi:alpha-galactosidase
MYRLAAFLALVCQCSFAQGIQYSVERKTWLLTTDQSSYAMGVGPDGALQHLYWGAPLWRIEDLPTASKPRGLSSFDPAEMMQNEEYPGWGGARYYEPALKITRSNGDRDLVLRYLSHEIRGSELDIVLKDIKEDIRVTLQYRIYPGSGILRRSAVVKNGTLQRSRSRARSPQCGTCRAARAISSAI